MKKTGKNIISFLISVSDFLLDISAKLPTDDITEGSLSKGISYKNFGLWIGH